MSNFISEGVGFWCLRLWKRTQELDEQWVFGFLKRCLSRQGKNPFFFLFDGLST